MTAVAYLFGNKRRKALDFGERRQSSVHVFSAATRNAVFYVTRSVLGIVFFACGAGIWALPGGAEAPEVRIMQIGLTALFMVIGYALFHGSQPSQKPELHVDLMRRCIRLAVRDLAGGSVTIAKYHLDELSNMAVIGNTFVAADLDGAEVVNLDLHDKDVANQLRDFLMDMPPLYRRTPNVFAPLPATV